MNDVAVQPLSSVLADFSRVLAGPFCTMTLGDLGAEVVKVERPGGDDTRGWGPPFVDGESTYYLGVNGNKRSIVLDLDDAEDLRMARTLVERADVVVENYFRPGVMARFGLDEPTLRQADPALVYCSISGFGTDAGHELARECVRHRTWRSGDQQPIQRLGERCIRDVRIGSRAADEDRNAMVDQLSGYLGGQARLTGSGFAADEHRLAVAALHPFPGLPERREFYGATDEWAAATRGQFGWKRAGTHCAMVSR